MFLILSGEINGLPFRSPNIEIDYSQDSSLDEKEAELLKKACLGDDAAQYKLAKCYSEKNSINWQNKFRAAYWYKKAAEQGNPQAQTSYGLLLQKGNGAEKDEKEAVIWFEKASAQNNNLAQYALGLAYLNGEGVTQDKDTAKKWLKLAADNEHIMARIVLKKEFGFDCIQAIFTDDE